MTAQRPYRLTNECEALDFSGLHLYRVLAHVPDSESGWDMRQSYRTLATPSPDTKIRCSALWSGYIPVYRVDAQARFWLVEFIYPLEKERPPESVNEPIQGDAWLFFCERFGGPAVHVPVKDGAVRGREEWMFQLDRERFVVGSELEAGAWPPSSNGRRYF
ncbi:hypothetical protein [Lysobacter enzymogenes]|uniref:hypothetical protein n=1 Tax=Lysobacter enzymogenes TaxID=69 RepID=UPI001AF71A54|nr:hypothetical protein [Lysobacter enzymogenes]QQQ02215.1 hypothetical protein JHW41_04285 [Lysobacter enzymogenes]